MLADCADRLVQIFAKKRADDLRMLFNRAFLPLGHDLIHPARALHLQPHLTEHTDDALAAGVFGKRGGVLCAGLLCIMQKTAILCGQSEPDGAEPKGALQNAARPFGRMLNGPPRF